MRLFVVEKKIFTHENSQEKYSLKARCGRLTAAVHCYCYWTVRCHRQL